MSSRNPRNYSYFLDTWLEDSTALITGIELEDLLVSLQMNLHFDSELKLIFQKLNQFKQELISSAYSQFKAVRDLSHNNPLEHERKTQPSLPTLESLEDKYHRKEFGFESSNNFDGTTESRTWSRNTGNPSFGSVSSSPKKIPLLDKNLKLRQQ
jgi:hypothetical protein